MAKFEKGHAGGPGRPKGSRNKLAEDFMRDISEAWEKRGKAALAELTPAELTKVAASLMPKDINVTHDVKLTDDERSTRIAELSAALGLGIGAAQAAHGRAGSPSTPKLN